jgi:D-alanyl-D-alanine carboxypeptidase
MKAGECVAFAQGAGVNVPAQSLLLRGHGRRTRRFGFSVAILLLAIAALPPPASAERVVAGPGGPIYEAIVLDAETGQVLRELNPDAVTYPASLTKMMTLYLTFEALNQGRLQLNQYLPVSMAAATHAPSRLGLQPGEAVTVRDLILAIVTKSANDAAAVLAEGLGGGSEAAFAQMMNQKAAQLGMTRTHYANASGLPDPEQLTTARDMARLALALYRDFPREYGYFSVTKFDFNGETVNGHDHMLGWYPGADGIKTGYTEASGFNLATSAVQNGHRLIGVILGGRTVRSRDESMAQMLDLGFGDIARQQPVLVAQRQQAAPATAVAAAAPTATPAVATQPAAQAQPSFAAVATTSMAPAATIGTNGGQPVSDAPAAHPVQSTVAAVASAALDHLAPVGKAEAAPMTPEPHEAWAIQLGAYRAEAAAERAEHEIAGLAFAKGKQTQILAPAGRERLYRARLVYFTELAARAACGELHHQHLACSVMPASVRVASR